MDLSSMNLFFGWNPDGFHAVWYEKEDKAVFFLTKWYLITYEKWILGKSKMVHEMDQILTDFDDFGVVEKLWISAVQRRQNYHE